ncbi:MAG: hypothetical protein RR525_09905 [Cellulosilyticaceae bacterium]
MDILKRKGCAHMNTQPIQNPISLLNYGCEDKSSQGEKCHKCIYNVTGKEKISCIFSQIE